MAGFKNLFASLVDRLATAHRPTVPPSGERTVTPVIAIAVAVTSHISKRLTEREIRLTGGIVAVKP
jgi:hypothetical protein